MGGAVGDRRLYGAILGRIPVLKPGQALQRASSNSSPLTLQQIADLDEQFLVLGQRRRRGFLLRPHDPAQELHDEEEQGEGNDEEIHYVAQEMTDLNRPEVPTSYTRLALG